MIKDVLEALSKAIEEQVDINIKQDTVIKLQKRVIKEQEEIIKNQDEAIALYKQALNIED